MKDRQIQSASAQPSILIVSPFLHWLAMPAIVFLRAGFGYSFLRPKSVFLAFCVASGLFFIYARMEAGAWTKNWAISYFTGGASVLYLLHLLIAFSRETQRKGKHDAYSGTSHLLRLPGFKQYRGKANFETMLHLWIEPVAVFVIATALRAYSTDHRLSTWLPYVALGMWLKEFMNYWYGLRSEKKREDLIEDAEEKMPTGGSFMEVPLPSAGGRKPRVRKLNLTTNQQPPQETEQYFAQILRLMPPYPPYDLKQAERHYLDLTNSLRQSPVKTESLEILTEAIEYFRSAVEGDKGL